MLAYYEICSRLKNKKWRHGSGKTPGMFRNTWTSYECYEYCFLGPSAYYKNQWVGYENTESIFAKGEYILQSGYGGATMWTIDLDDFLNRCCSEPFPLLKTINRALGRYINFDALETRSIVTLSIEVTETTWFLSLGRLKSKPTQDCRQSAEPVTPPPPTLTTHSDAAAENPRPTSSMTKPTTWPGWSEKPSTTTPTTTWPSWTWTPKPSKQPESTTKSSTLSWTRPSSVSWTWTSTKYVNWLGIRSRDL